MKYLKKFETHTEYDAYKASEDYLTPNVSYCADRNEVHFEKYVRDYSKEYLTTKALGTGTISFNIFDTMGTEYITSISYSTDNGNTWSTIANEDNKENNLSIDVNMNDGGIILWKGNAKQLGFFSEDDGEYMGSSFSSTCEFDVSGNVMSMLYGDNFIGKTDYMNTNGIFAYLFSDYYNEHTCMVKSSKDLILPADTLADGCYHTMFTGCTSLTTAPQLPATTLARNCYCGMFDGCTSLTTAPELPVTTLAVECYYSMFKDCTSLTTAPELPATILADGCYGYMFNGCTSLTTAPELPATTLTRGCYSDMFTGCTSLTTAPELPADTLADDCYNTMFKGCTSLTTAPKLSATTLARNCYSNMFDGCTSLISAPELPATKLVISCYHNMFRNCSRLNYIKAMFTTTPSATYTSEWVSGVSSTGTFVKNSAATWNVTGVNGVPTGWTIQTASA